MTKTVTTAADDEFHRGLNGKTVIGTAVVSRARVARRGRSMLVYYHGHNSQGSIEGYIKA